MVGRSLLVSALALAAACRSTPPAQPPSTASADQELRLAALEQRLELLEKLLGGKAPADGAIDQSPLPADSAARVSRVEARLDKVVGFLKQAVRPEVDASQLYAMPIDPRDPSLGPADAPVTIVEAYEFLCPYCHLIEPILDRLRAEYPKGVRVVSKYLVIHGAAAVPSGLGACAAQRQGRYEPYKNATWSAIWDGEESPDRDAVSVDGLRGLVKTAGLDAKKYQADVATGGPCEQWLSSTEAVLEKFGTSGTPTLMINGRLVEERDYDGLKAAVDTELARVKASGVAPGRYYADVVLARGKGEAVLISPFD